MLKHLLLGLCVLALVPVVACAQEDAKAEAKTITGTTQVIAVVDVQQLLLDSKAAKSIQDSAKAARDKYQKEIATIEKKLKDKDAAFVKEREKLSQEEIVKKHQDFQKDLIESQKKVAEMNQKLDHAVADSLNKIRDEIVTIVAEMAAKNGYDLVISRQEVVVVAKTMDITAQVMDALNKKLPNAKIKL